LAFKFYEVQDYLFDTKHFFSVSTYGMNQDFWDSLTEEEQAIVEEAAEEAVNFSWDNKEKSTEEAKDELIEEGMDVSEPSSELREELIEMTEPVYEWYYEKNPWAEELVDKILAD